MNKSKLYQICNFAVFISAILFISAIGRDLVDCITASNSVPFYALLLADAAGFLLTAAPFYFLGRYLKKKQDAKA